MKFEVGKFYAVHMRWGTDKIPALCIRVTKCTVTFQYLYRRVDGVLKKMDTRRRKRTRMDGMECAYCPEKWTDIISSYADEFRDKPKRWDEVQ